MAGNGKRSKKQVKTRFKIKLDWKNLLLYGTLAVIGTFFLFGLVNPPQFHETIPLTQVVKDVKEGKVEEIIVSGDKLIIKEKDNKTFIAHKEPGSKIDEFLKNGGADPSSTTIIFENQDLNNALGGFLSFLPVIVMIAFFLFLFRQARGAQENIF